MIKKLGILLFVLVVASSLTGLVFAQTDAGDAPAGSSGGTVIDLGDLNPLGSSCKDIECVLEKILSLALTLVMAIMPFIILYGAYKIMTAGGDPKKFQEGGKTILYAVVGFIIALLAKNLVSILLDVVKETT